MAYEQQEGYREQLTKSLQATAAVICGWEADGRHNAVVAGASAPPAAVTKLGLGVSTRMKSSAFITVIALALTSCAKPTVAPKGHTRETVAGPAASTWNPPLIFYTNENQTIAPLSYTDKKSGVIYRVESDGRHVSASTGDGKQLWRRNPFVDAQMEPYRCTKPVIVTIGAASDIGYTGDPDAIWIRFNSSQTGWIDQGTGDFHFVLQD